MSVRRAYWAGVEFQPDLKHPTQPVRLGLVLHEVTKSGAGPVIVIGRLPKLESRPQAFKDISPTTMEIAAKWVSIMAKDAVGGSPDDLFARLADSWHWNLYVAEATEITLTESADLVRRAKALFKQFVGEPFGGVVRHPTAVKKRAPKPRGGRYVQSTPLSTSAEVPHYTPGAWMIAQIAPHLAAHQ
jgi:hypothetical protein